MPSPNDRPMRLSVHRAFVVQLHMRTEGEPGDFVGRVEHIVSGQALDFQSLGDLVAFMTQVLHIHQCLTPEETA